MIRFGKAEHFSGALREPIGGARAPLKERAGFLFSLLDEHGRVGVGEASPLPGTSRETLATVRAVLDVLGPLMNEPAWRERKSPYAEDLTPTSAAEFCAELEAATFALSPASLPAELTAFPPSVRCGIEIALSDLASRARGVTVARWLSDGTPQTRIDRSVLCGAIDRPDLLARARAHVLRGARTLKLKVAGDAVEAELRSLLELRAMLDQLTRGELPGVRIRLDLNGALDVSSAHEALAVYAQANIELCEEPVRGALLRDLGRTNIPWFADESLCDRDLAHALLSTDACAGFVVKPMLLGFFDARRLALAAIRAGKKVVVTHTFDGPVALAAACELALSLPKNDLAQGLDAHPALDVFPSIAVQELQARDGNSESAIPLSIHAKDQPGLGISWEPKP